MKPEQERIGVHTYASRTVRLCMAAIFVVLALVVASEVTALTTLGVGLAAAVPAVALAVRCARLGVRITGDRLIVCGVVRTMALPLADVGRFEVAVQQQPWWLRGDRRAPPYRAGFACLTDGQRIRLAAISETRYDRDFPERTVEALNRDLGQIRSAVAADSPRQR